MALTVWRDTPRASPRAPWLSPRCVRSSRSTLCTSGIPSHDDPVGDDPDQAQPGEAKARIGARRWVGPTDPVEEQAALEGKGSEADGGERAVEQQPVALVGGLADVQASGVGRASAQGGPDGPHRVGAVSYTHLDVYKRQRLFHYSITYLTVLFVAVAVDPLLYLAIPGLAR